MITLSSLLRYNLKFCPGPSWSSTCLGFICSYVHQLNCVKLIRISKRRLLITDLFYGVVGHLLVHFSCCLQFMQKVKEMSEKLSQENVELMSVERSLRQQLANERVEMCRIKCDKLDNERRSHVRNPCLFIARFKANCN